MIFMTSEEAQEYAAEMQYQLNEAHARASHEIEQAEEVYDDLMFFCNDFAVKVTQIKSRFHGDGFWIHIIQTLLHPNIDRDRLFEEVYNYDNLIEVIRVSTWAEMMTVVNNAISSARDGGDNCRT